MVRAGEIVDGYIVWGPGELPRIFRNMKETLKELERNIAGKHWASDSIGTLWRSISYRMLKDDHDRITAVHGSVRFFDLIDGDGEPEQESEPESLKGWRWKRESPNLDYVLEATGSDNDARRRIAEVGLDWLATLLKKNADYGSSVWNAPVLKPGMDCGDAILVRMSDKVNRIASLIDRSERGGGGPEIEESLEDTIKDLGGYSLLWLARPDGDDVQEGDGSDE